jgi:hypothetical protein
VITLQTIDPSSLQRGRSTSRTKKLYEKKNKIWSCAPKGSPAPRQTGRLTTAADEFFHCFTVQPFYFGEDFSERHGMASCLSRAFNVLREIKSCKSGEDNMHCSCRESNPDSLPSTTSLYRLSYLGSLNCWEFCFFNALCQGLVRRMASSCTDEWQRMWKEAAIAQLAVSPPLPRHTSIREIPGCHFVNERCN